MFYNSPFITNKEISSVNKSMRSKSLSKFVGTLTSETKKYLIFDSFKARKNLPNPNYLGGPNVRECEFISSKITKSRYSVLFNSASSALFSAIKSLGLKNKSKIVVPAVSFSATISAVVAANYTPVICDIDESGTMCPKFLKKLLKKQKIQAVIFVQWCGNQGNISEIARVCKSNKKKLIEDSSQATFTKTEKNKFNGTHGDIGIFSFNEPKNLSSGEGGMAITNNQTIAKSMRLTRNHGEAYQLFKDYSKFKKYFFSGYNFRPTEYCAAIIKEQIKRRHEINNFRIRNYKKIVKETKNILIPLCNYKNFVPYSGGFYLNSNWKINKYQLSKILSDKGFNIFTSYPIEHWNLFRHLSKKSHLNNINYYENNFICVFQIGFPVSIKEINSLCKEIKKIFYNQEQYLRIKELKNFNIGRK